MGGSHRVTGTRDGRGRGAVALGDGTSGAALSSITPEQENSRGGDEDSCGQEEENERLISQVAGGVEVDNVDEQPRDDADEIEADKSEPSEGGKECDDVDTDTGERECETE